MRYLAPLVFLVLLLSATSFGQLPSSLCDSIHSTLADCTLLTQSTASGSLAFDESPTVDANPDQSDSQSQNPKPNALRSSDNDSTPGAVMVTPQAAPKPGFHWGRALMESFTLLSIEQAYVIKDDWRWVTVEKGIPFNHYWRDYKQSLSSWVHSGWDDGDPHLYSYVGHPVQGAFTSYIQIQNDPKGENLEFSNTKAYWRSRLKATLWNAVYSTQWNIGPLSEMTVEKYGAKVRPPWNSNGTWPCNTKHCSAGVGQVDLVMTPLGGFGWLVGEEYMDKQIMRRVERKTRNRFLIDTVRCSLNPIRGGANILHGKRPWYRPRDTMAVDPGPGAKPAGEIPAHVR